MTLKKLERRSDWRGYAFKAMVPIGVLAVVVGAALAWLAFFTDVCSIKTVVVKGNEHLTVEYIRDRSGVDNHTNLVTLPVGRLDENLENDPWVKEANVGRHLLHSVRIEVVERKPIAMVDFSGAAFLVDDQAHVIAQGATEEFPDIPMVHGGDASVPTVDARVSNKKIRECIEVIGAMPQGLRATLAIANPYDGRGYVFISRGGYNIVYGPATECPRKDEILEAIVYDITSNKRGVAYVDVTVPDCPVIKPI